MSAHICVKAASNQPLVQRDSGNSKHTEDSCVQTKETEESDITRRPDVFHAFPINRIQEGKRHRCPEERTVPPKIHRLSSHSFLGENNTKLISG